MAKDKANIFKLSPAEFKAYQENPFFDSFLNTKVFADELSFEIETRETPYVLLLEGNYGVGKTFFSTRFKQYLSGKFETVYFSVWENDYLPDPFLAFSKALIQHFDKHRPIKATTKKALQHPIVKILKSLAKSINFSIPNIPVSFDLGACIDSLEENFSGGADPIVNFKREFEDFIKKTTKGEKLVIIVDELDRCRPDYSMKVLEITKHFFDIEGLFVIIPTNKLALKRSLEALYGINIEQEDKDINIESYYKKFFNDEREIPEPNYENTVASIITQESLKLAFDKQNLIKKENAFNDYSTLIAKVAKYCSQRKFSLRQTKDICENTIWFCNYFYEPVRCEYLAYLLCNKEMNKKLTRDNKPINLSLDSANPYSSDEVRLKMLNLEVFNALAIKNINEIQRQSSANLFHISDRFKNSFREKLSERSSQKTYTEVQKLLDELLTLVNSTISEVEKIQNYSPNNFATKLLELKNIIEKQITEIEFFKEKYDGDDDFYIRKDQYRLIVEKPNILATWQNLIDKTPQLT